MNHLTSSCLFSYLFTSIYLYLLLLTNTKCALASYRSTTIANPVPRPPLPALLLNTNNNNNNRQIKEEDDQANGKPAASKFTLANTNRTNHQREPNMKHACENNQLELTCQEGKLIHMARATYGRFSLSVCNELGHTNLSVQCASFRAFLIMETRCNKLNNCTVTVSKELFGDPCEGTSKYLEVQYYCHDANNNNSNNNQQQQSAPSSTPPHISFGGSLLTTATANRPPFNGNPSGQQVTGAPGGGGHKSPAQDQQVGGGELSVGKTAATGTNSDELLSEQQQQQQSHATNVIQQQQQQPRPSHLYCEPQTSSRKLYWNYTRAGQFARQSCPEGSFGRASWYCDAERFHFRPAWSPDFSQCKTIWLQRLAEQLDKLLESPNKQQLVGASSGPVRQQNEQNLRNLLNDLDILVHNKDLFSEDLKRIDIMIGQIIAQQRSLSVSSMSTLLGTGENNWPTTGVPYDSIYEHLFSRLVSIVSALFEVSQRAAWLEVQPADSRRKLEQRFLGHLKESGAMLASFLSNNHQLDQQAFSRRQPNVFAAITVIKRFNINNSSLDYNLNLDELNNFQVASSSGSSQTTNKLVPMAHQFELHSSVAKELLANGVTRLLVLDIIKPDYSHIRQQLDFYQGGGNVVANEAPFEINLFDVQQRVSRVLGVFAVVGESGDILDGNDDSQRERRLAELLSQRPISVDFKVPQPAGQQQVVQRQCNSLQDGGATSQTNRCQTFRSNATNQICRCDRFGFLALSASAPPDRMLQVPFVAGADFQWPSEPAVVQPASEMAAPAYGELDVTSGNRLDQAPADYIKPAQGKQQQQQQALGFWTTSFIVIGLILFVFSLAGLIASATLRANGQSRLNKKQQHFLTGGATPGSMLAHHRDLSSSGQTTTGPLTDHSLLSEEQLIAAGAINNNNNNNNSNIAGNHSAPSVMGLTAQSAGAYHEPGVCYKAAQQQQHQLYAAHLPHMSGSLGRSANRWPRWTDWLRPSRWLSQNGGHSKELMIQHRVIGNSSLASAGSLAAHYKGQYQNGYTTNLHHSPALAQMPLAAPSSSTSSYVSSSAYYEEIGPGNLTRLSTSQLTSGAPRHTVVDPFKPRQAAADQQQLVSHTSQHPGGHVLHHSLAHWAAHSASTSSPQDSQQQQPGNLANANYGQPLLNNSAYNKQQFHTDLSQLQTGNNNSQSSSSSAGSQHSASTNITTANGGSTPRHYLFASPSAVSAYKSSMSHYPTAYH